MHSPASFPSVFCANSSNKRAAFTLIELLTVIAIIAVLMGLLFPALNAVKENARKTQAKNDIVNLTAAVTAFNAEYSKYPIPANKVPSTGDYTYDAKSGNTNDLLLLILMAKETATPVVNTRKIAFINPPIAKTPTGTANPKGGLGTNNQWYDPWGKPYSILMDADYDNTVTNPYTNAGPAALTMGCVGWSFGPDSVKTAQAAPGDRSKDPCKDDVLSWQ